MEPSENIGDPSGRDMCLPWGAGHSWGPWLPAPGQVLAGAMHAISSGDQRPIRKHTVNLEW